MPLFEDTITHGIRFDQHSTGLSTVTLHDGSDTITYELPDYLQDLQAALIHDIIANLSREDLYSANAWFAKMTLKNKI